jgi:hypothetical protein
MHKNSVAPARRGLEALGMIVVTKEGRGGCAEYRQVAEYRLTYVFARDNVNNELRPTHDWQQWEGKAAAAELAAKEARARKDPRAVARGKKHYGAPGKLQGR